MDIDLTLLVAGSCSHREAIARRGAPWRSVDFPSLVAVVRHPLHGAVLFDTGYAPRFFAETEHLPGAVYGRALPVRLGAQESAAAQLRASGLDLADVGTVVVSHLHADHVAGLRDLGSARVVLGRDALRAADQVQRGGLRGWRGLPHGLLPGLLPDDLRARAVPAEDLAAVRTGLPAPFDVGRAVLADGSVIAVDLPGHAPGHLGLLVRSRGLQVLLVGDAAWSLEAVTRPALPHPVVRLVTHRWRAYRRTLWALHALAHERPDVVVVPSHCPVAIARAREALAGREAQAGEPARPRPESAGGRD